MSEITPAENSPVLPDGETPLTRPARGPAPETGPGVQRALVAEQPLLDPGKHDLEYLDVGTNRPDTGLEKSAGTFAALELLAARGVSEPHVVEIGPGGGAALNTLGEYARENVHLQPRVTMLEAPGVESAALQEAMNKYSRLAPVRLEHGWAKELTQKVPERADVLTTSAVGHEIVSYAGGYYGLADLLRILPDAINPYGYFAHRDIHAVDQGSLHDPVEQTYTSKDWIQFIRMFAPYYLENSNHPYRRYTDMLTARQDSRHVPVAELDSRKIANFKGPQGLFREIQRHYITARKDVLRSGIFGYRPVEEGPHANDWIDAAGGLRRVHFDLTSEADPTPPPLQPLRNVSEAPSFCEHWTVDGDRFDEMTGVAFGRYMDGASGGEEPFISQWQQWRGREGKETYAYFSRSELLSAVAAETAASGQSVLLPTAPEHVRFAGRGNYDRILGALPNPMRDGKQLALFQNVPLTDRKLIDRALQQVILPNCTRADYLAIYKAVNV